MRRTVDKFSLLSVGNTTHTGDPRFKVTFQYPNNWRLHINPMLKDDAGLYMCQVSTHPPRVFTTNVTVMREYKSSGVGLLFKPLAHSVVVPAVFFFYSFILALLLHIGHIVIIAKCYVCSWNIVLVYGNKCHVVVFAI